MFEPVGMSMCMIMQGGSDEIFDGSGTTRRRCQLKNWSRAVALVVGIRDLSVIGVGPLMAFETQSFSIKEHQPRVARCNIIAATKPNMAQLQSAVFEQLRFSSTPAPMRR